MELFHRLQHWQQQKIKSIDFNGMFQNYRDKSLFILQRVRVLGVDNNLDDYEKRKLRIFNQLNFFQLLTGLMIPVLGIFTAPNLPVGSWLVACLPALVSVVVLWLNSLKRYELALLSYFIFYPVFTCIIFINGMNLGVELFFVLYGILSVFFLQDIGYMIFSLALSMMSYVILSVILKNYQYQLKSLNFFVFLMNQLLAMGYIFYGLYLIKKENADYQLSIMKQKSEMAGQALLLQKQADELADLNLLNNKLFSLISHDLKAPMYALRNFFQNAKDLKLSAREIKGMLPDVINDLNYTTGLMENLLQWAKSQLQSNEVRPQELDINEIIGDVVNLLRLQADAKKIRIERKTPVPAYAWADKDMINLVIRNLLSNAIKFTQQGGIIVIGCEANKTFTEVFIKDNGIGISREEMVKINQNNFYTTHGTACETGTGLGLSLCKEFLGRNGGRLLIESEPGEGSTFSFTLPQRA
ncbi:MAG TPA: HAMP domain-containing sensor histidine kinase [Chitinophagaceae bacterium]|nr:HAMP domain-containing sensor histidine kinase [Chitinophagaceae bacterium]